MESPETFESGAKETPLSPEQKEQLAALEIALVEEEEDVLRQVKSERLASTWWEKNYPNVERAIGNIF